MPVTVLALKQIYTHLYIYLYIHSVLALKKKLGAVCKAAFVADHPQVSAGQQQVSDVLRSIGDRMPQHTTVCVCVCLYVCVFMCVCMQVRSK
jgi:hypothetical protein